MLFSELERQGWQVALQELGLFAHENQRIVGQIGFWWSENLNGYMEREPEQRGAGWSEDTGTYVHYRLPEAASVPGPWGSVAVIPETTPEISEEPPERYVERPCDRCGRILPMNELSRHTHEVQTGRTSGTTRSSRSTTSRASPGSFSNWTRHGSSRTSGRTYYRTETLLSCEACYPAQRQGHRTFLQLVRISHAALTRATGVMYRASAYVTQ